MATARKQRNYAFALSVVAHAAIVALLTFSIPLTPPQRSAGPNVVPIETVMIDGSAVAAEMARIEQAEADREAERLAQIERERVAAERLQRQQEEQQQQIAAEQRELVRIQREREEAERIAADEKIRLQAEAQQETERLARIEQERLQREAAERERERLAEIERQKVEAQRIAAEKAAEEERQRLAAAERAKQAQLEGELAAALAVEEEAQRARDSGQLDQYVRSIENKIRQRWIRPPSSVGINLECVVNVTQIPSGEVTSVSVGRCNGDEAVVRSIENAVLSASPLPPPPVPSVFARSLAITFIPED